MYPLFSQHMISKKKNKNKEKCEEESKAFFFSKHKKMCVISVGF